MTDFRVVAMDHVDITAPEDLVDDVAAWYRDVLGLDSIDTSASSRVRCGFGLGDSELHISVDERNPPKVAHFCVRVDGYDAFIERLRAAGCHIEQAGDPGRQSCYTRDPAGNRVEVTDAAARKE